MSEFWFGCDLSQTAGRSSARFDVDKSGEVTMTVADRGFDRNRYVTLTPSPDQLAALAMQALKARSEALELLREKGPN